MTLAAAQRADWCTRASSSACLITDRNGQATTPPKPAKAAAGADPAPALATLSISIQQSESTTWRLAKMNLAIHRVEGRIAYGDTSYARRHTHADADCLPANPPFHVSEWGGEGILNTLAAGVSR